MLEIFITSKQKNLVNSNIKTSFKFIPIRISIVGAQFKIKRSPFFVFQHCWCMPFAVNGLLAPTIFHFICFEKET